VTVQKKVGKAPAKQVQGGRFWGEEKGAGKTYAAAGAERELAGEAQGAFQVDIRATFPVRKVNKELAEEETTSSGRRPRT
jgi:hypothetical protein